MPLGVGNTVALQLTGPLVIGSPNFGRITGGVNPTFDVFWERSGTLVTSTFDETFLDLIATAAASTFEQFVGRKVQLLRAAGFPAGIPAGAGVGLAAWSRDQAGDGSPQDSVLVSFPRSGGLTIEVPISALEAIKGQV